MAELWLKAKSSDAKGDAPRDQNNNIINILFMIIDNHNKMMIMVQQ